MLSYQRAGGARVVEVDVREEQVPQIVELDAACPECVVQRGKAARRAAVEEREAVVGLDEVCGDTAGIAAMQEVEWIVRHARDAISG